MMSFLQLAAEKNTSFVAVGIPNNIRTFLFCQSFTQNTLKYLKTYLADMPNQPKH